MRKKIIFIFILAAFIFSTENIKADEINMIQAPTALRATTKQNTIKLKWKKVQGAKGYVVYKNGKKIKKVKKATWTDKKAKVNKTNEYKVKAFYETAGKKVYSNYSYQVTAKVTNKKSKKVNAARFVNVKDSYSLCLNGKMKLSAKVKPKQKEKKKKLFNNKLVWYSSNEKLATVSANGNVQANNKMMTGTVYIYARAHNGLTKKIKIVVSNYAKPTKFKNMYAVEDDIKPVITTYKNDITEVASYFEFEKPNADVVFDIDKTGKLSKSVDIEIRQDIEEKLYKIMHSLPVTIAVHKKYLVVERKDYTVYGSTIINSIFYQFATGSTEDFYNGYNWISIAPHWYSQFLERGTYSDELK